MPTLAVLGGRDPLLPSPARVREVARLAPEHLAVVLVEKAAHAVNFSHPEELAGAIEVWLDDALVEGVRLPDGVRLLVTRRSRRRLTASGGCAMTARLDLGGQDPRTRRRRAASSDRTRASK